MLACGWVVFDRYALESRVGRGGMGVVWRAHDELADEAVALKFLADVIMRDAVAVDDLRQETTRARRLVHDHIARINDFMRDHRFATISMEYVDGETLERSRLAQPGGVFSVATLAPLVGQLCLALDYAHRTANIAHGDLKPANVLVTSEGTVKIIDFGIARSLRAARLRFTSESGRGRESNFYLSPQQLDGGGPAAADDIYALGAMVYELLTGKPPFTADDIASQIRSAEAPLMAACRAESGMAGEPIPSAWETTIAACLAKDPAGRPSSAGEIARLLGIVGGRPAAAEPLPVDTLLLGNGPTPHPLGAVQPGRSAAPGGSRPAFEKLPLEDSPIRAWSRPPQNLKPAAPLSQPPPKPPVTPVAIHASPAPPAVASTPSTPSSPIPAVTPVAVSTTPAPQTAGSTPSVPPPPEQTVKTVAVRMPEVPAAVTTAGILITAAPTVVSAPAIPSLASITPAISDLLRPPATPVEPKPPVALVRPKAEVPPEPNALENLVPDAPAALPTVASAPAVLGLLPPSPPPVPPIPESLPNFPVASTSLPTPAPIPQNQSVAPVPQVARPTPSAKLPRPGLPRKRTAIHYPSPREAQEEAEAAEMAATPGTDGATRKRSWVARAWHEFLRY